MAVPMVVGATIVSLGTIAPETAVSALAAIEGSPGLAVRNSVGSMIADTGLSVEFCVIVHTMATNLGIDPDLLEKALAIGGERTKKATVNRALKEFIVRRSQERLLDLFGTLDWDSDYDYKSERSRE